MSMAAGALIGSQMGAGLGAIGDTLSAPRRAVWRALGLPEQGNELIARMTGWDASGLPAHLLGLGLEVVGDPLTYLGGMVGAPLGYAWKISGQLADDAAAKATLAAEHLAKSRAELAALENINKRLQGSRAALYDQSLNALDVSANPAWYNTDLAGIMRGSTTRAAYMDPLLAEELHRLGYVREPLRSPVQSVGTDQYIGMHGTGQPLVPRVTVIGGRMPDVGMTQETLRRVNRNVRAGSAYFHPHHPIDLPPINDDLYAALTQSEAAENMRRMAEMMPRGQAQNLFPPPAVLERAAMDYARRQANRVSLEEMLMRTLQADEAGELMSQMAPYPTIMPRAPGGMQHSMAEAQRLLAAQAAEAEMADRLAAAADYASRRARRQITMQPEDYMYMAGAGAAGAALGDALYRYEQGGGPVPRR